MDCEDLFRIAKSQHNQPLTGAEKLLNDIDLGGYVEPGDEEEMDRRKEIYNIKGDIKHYKYKLRKLKNTKSVTANRIIAEKRKKIRKKLEILQIRLDEIDMERNKQD